VATNLSQVTPNFIYLFIYKPYFNRVAHTDRPDFQWGPVCNKIKKQQKIHCKKKYVQISQIHHSFTLHQF